MFKDRAIALMAFGQTLMWASSYYVFPALLLRWEHELGWSKTALTAAIGLAVLVSALFSPLAGKVIDQGRGPQLMAGSAFAGGIGLLMLSQVSALWQFYTVWAFIGMAMAGCLYEPCFMLVTRARGTGAKRGIIFITLLAGFASTICYPTVYTLAEWIGWRATLMVLGAVVIVLVSPILWHAASALEKETPKVQVSQHLQASQPNRFLEEPAFWCLAIGFAFIAFVHGATLHHLLPLFHERGLSDRAAILAVSFIGPMQIAGRLAMMASEKYASLHRVTGATFFMLAVSLVTLYFGGASTGFLLPFVIFFGGAYGTVSILRPLIAREILGERDFGAKSGALALPYLAGAALAPYLASLIWKYGGYNTVLATSFGCTITGWIFYLIANRFARRHRADNVSRFP
jgi:predicted MFS family arabinose efflux permease